MRWVIIFLFFFILGCASLPHVSSTSFREGMTKDEIMALFDGYNPTETVKQLDGREMWRYIRIHDMTDSASSSTIYSLYFEDDLLKAWKVERKEASDIDKLIKEERQRELERALDEIY